MQQSSFLENNVNMAENIKKIPALESFEDQELNQLLEMSKIHKYKAGERIFEEGTYDTWMYFLMYGSIKIVKKDKEIATLKKKGEIFGEIGAIENSARSASAYAITDTVCLATDIFYLEKQSQKDKQRLGYVLYRLLANILARRLRRTTNELVHSKKSLLNLKFW
ncbi:MAG: cyclic nucleotide-binding domain-containing protein [Desulfobacteraceae bacterium]|nr:cyclic nucleotide-binding domain-containing protein [Desulfobacteraceae bacterium]